MSMPGKRNKDCPNSSCVWPKYPLSRYRNCLAYFMNWLGDILATFHVLSASGPIKVYLQWSWIHRCSIQFRTCSNWISWAQCMLPLCLTVEDTVVAIWTQDGDLLTLLPRTTSLAFQIAQNVYLSSSQLFLDSWRGPRVSEVSNSWCPVSDTQCWTLEEPCLPTFWIFRIKHWQLLSIIKKEKVSYTDFRSITQSTHRLQFTWWSQYGSASPDNLWTLPKVPMTLTDFCLTQGLVPHASSLECFPDGGK